MTWQQLMNVATRRDTGRPLFFTTASLKKRKLSQDPPLEHEPSEPASTSTASDNHRTSDLPRLSSPPPSVGSRASASPPRYIPPHLRDEVLETVAESDGTPCDSNASGGSSPSEAYAGLSLESKTRSVNSNTGRRGSPVGSEQTQLKAVASAEATQPQPRPSVAQSPSRRSLSPAKRSASEMAGENDSREQMEAENGITRGTSVDMLMEEQNKEGASFGSSETTSTSVNESNNTSTTATSDAAQSPPASKDQSAASKSIDEQVGQIWALHQKELQEGQKGYIVSMWWLSRVLARSSNKEQFSGFDKSRLEGEVGPIDNDDILEEDASAWEQDHVSEGQGQMFVPIKPNLQYGDDFEVFPEEAWNLMVSWYGIKPGSPPIIRYVHDTAPPGSNTSNLQYEIYPPFFTIRKLLSSSEPMTPQRLREKSQNAARLQSSRSEKFQDFLKRAKEAAGIPMSSKVQIWRVLELVQPASAPKETGNSGVLTPATSRSVSPARNTSTPFLIDAQAFSSLAEGAQREMIDHKDETNNPKYNEEWVGGPAGGEFLSDNVRKQAQKHGVSLSAGKNALDSKTDSGRSSPAPGGPMTRGRTKNGKTRGTVGLSNLGNTCYMNSALQCIRSVEELTAYFLQNKYKEELNPDNPLGHNGAIAKAYAGLLAAIYEESTTTSFSPKNFKYALGRAQPMFSGYGQQDSQEFLSFLVDGLHEDLNRIQKKPYIENPESDDNTHKDPEAIKALGEKYRQLHKARNDSIAMDLFNGFYKNTMVCPDCDKVSIAFDPFSSLTLQLPIENNWQHTVHFVPLRGDPFKIDVELEPNRPMKALKEYVAARVPGLDPKRTMVSEVYGHKFFKHFDDRFATAEQNIGEKDDIVVYELDDEPTNYPPPKKASKVRSMLYTSSEDDDIPDSASPLADRMMVPVFHRCKDGRNPNSDKWSNTLWPSHIVLRREQAKDYDEILRKVLGRVAVMTTRDIFAEEDSSSQIFGTRTVSDTVMTTEEDASSVTDNRVKANSIEGDESIVDVSMTEAPEAGKETNEDVTMHESTSEASALQPGAFIGPGLRRLFALKYYKPGDEMVPTGWSSLSNQELPTIESRMPVSQSRRSSVQSDASHESKSSLGGQRDESPESEETEDTAQFSNTVDSFDVGPQSEDELASAVPTFKQNNKQKFQRNQARRGKGKKNRKMKTDGRKDRKNGGNSRAGSEPLVSEPDGEPMLIRLGEVIVVDWDAESYDALFGGVGSEKNDMRGVDKWDHMDTLEDPALAAKRRRRAAKKKSGITLEDCFAETAKTEILSEENAWYCDRCKEHRRASKTLEIWTAPDILMIHLKRFGATRGSRDKIEILVDFPIEGLDITKRVGLDEGKSLIYDLFAVDNHFGGLGGGHYTAVGKNFFDGQWYDYNDSMVSKKSPQNIVNGSAYLLFYRRRQEAPLGPPYLQDIVRQAYAPESEPSDSDTGNERRLGDISPLGSPSAGNGVEAGRLVGAGAAGSAGATATAAAAVTTTSLATINDNGYDDDVDAAEPPPYVDDDAGEGFPGEWNYISAGAGQQRNNNSNADDDTDGASVDANRDEDEDDDDVFDDRQHDFEPEVDVDFEPLAGSGGAPGPGTPADYEESSEAAPAPSVAVSQYHGGSTVSAAGVDGEVYEGPDGGLMQVPASFSMDMPDDDEEEDEDEDGKVAEIRVDEGNERND
ncbi:hypothetical protein IWX90DRAFT_488144 [Phyllosticta citrichinensis]|uniref:ubiquitinyl hydrolase 1 n=1 Tax=Phyllosticta citrichinensis TaxID=1130410 RepID=A0ABR1XN19_9PEZI